MPEVRFAIRWPDGARETCYSPSRVVKDYLVAGEAYGLADFLARSRAALLLASERVAARYGTPCPRALGQLAQLEAAGRRHAGQPDARVAVEAFIE